MRSSRTLMALLAATFGVAACSSGGDEPMGAEAPQITGLVAVQVNQDTSSAPLEFRIDDRDTAPEMLVIAVESSNEAVVAVDGVQVTGSGNVRSLMVSPLPDATGDSVITLRVTDDRGLMASANFDVRVAAVLRSFRMLASDSFEARASAEPVSLRGFTVEPDADDDPGAFNELLD